MAASPSSRSSDELFGHVAKGGNGEAVNRLLSAFSGGYSLENLRALLRNANDDVAEAGAFIAAELGTKFAPLTGELPAMLRHRSVRVRLYALDAVLNAVENDRKILAEAIGLVLDDEKRVRWKALRFLSRATEEQLRSGAEATEDRQLAKLIGWIANLPSMQMERAKREAKAALASEDAIRRRIAAVAAARLAPDDPGPLREAAESRDPDVRQFARDEVELLSP